MLHFMSRRRAPNRSALLILAGSALVAAACGSGSESPADQNQAQRELSTAYAQLYNTADGLSGLDALLYVKFESDAVDHFVSGMADDMAALAEEIEAATEGVAWIDLEDQGLPAVEIEKRSKAQFDRGLGLAPLVGRTGADFERTLLLTLSGGLNQSRYLVEVMLDREEHPARRELLIRAKTTFDRLYDADVDLLNARYFCNEALDAQVTDDAGSRDFDGDADAGTIDVPGEVGEPDQVDPADSETQAEVNQEQQQRRDAQQRNAGPRGKGSP